MSEDNKVIEIKSNIEKLELYSESYPFNLSLRIKDFEGEKEFTKFIKNCEKLVRGSLEYRLWRNYITDVLQFTKCEITEEQLGEVSIDIHHHIPSLYILIKSIINKKINLGEEFSTFDICLEAIKLHFLNKLGFVNIFSGLHEKFHNGFLQIPVELIRGDYKSYLEEYDKYLDEEDKELIYSRLSISIKDWEFGWSKDNYPAEKKLLVATG